MIEYKARSIQLVLKRWNLFVRLANMDDALDAKSADGHRLAGAMSGTWMEGSLRGHQA
jgi:hypothetical protein